MIAVPLRYDRRAVGVLKVFSPRPNAFGDRDVQTLQLMAGLIAAALSHAAAYEAKQALVAERTGALRQSEERLRLLWESAAVLTSDQPDAMLRGLYELAVTPPPEPVRVEADATRLVQVVANLLNNAAKYTVERGRVGLTVERDGGEAVVRVRDSGVGIPGEMLAQVFDLFTQVTDSQDCSQGGLGIGLTLARSLVEMHGGSVRAYSDGPGQGSEFVVRLPLLAERRSEGDGPVVSGRVVDLSARILVVDDNVDTADSLAVLLWVLGNDVRTAHDGPAALAAAQDYRPDVVLLDLGLPRMSGYEVCRHLRERHFANGPLVVALIGYGQDHDGRRTREAGFDRHPVKPVNADELLEVLAEGCGSPKSPACNPERAGCGNRQADHLLRAG